LLKETGSGIHVRDGGTAILVCDNDLMDREECLSSRSSLTWLPLPQMEKQDYKKLVKLKNKFEQT